MASLFGCYLEEHIAMAPVCWGRISSIWGFPDSWVFPKQRCSQPLQPVPFKHLRPHALCLLAWVGVDWQQCNKQQKEEWRPLQLLYACWVVICPHLSSVEPQFYGFQFFFQISFFYPNLSFQWWEKKATFGNRSHSEIIKTGFPPDKLHQ